MNPNEQNIRYADLPMPAAGELTAVAPGVFWLRMQLPFALDHINLWLLEDRMDGVNGWTAIDTGVATDPTRAAWQHIIEKHLRGLPILRVLCTHFHPDHMGLAAWLCQGAHDGRWRAPLWINYAEYGAARIWSSPDIINMAAHFHRHGITDPDMLTKLRERRNHYPALVPEVPSSFRRIFAHELIRIGDHDWRVIPGYGHSPEHCALSCQNLNLLISGDMVLPRISTNMSVWAQEPDADPLKLYLDSLGYFDSLPDDVLVLPSHGKPFGAAKGETAGGLKVRIKQLRDHHDDRLAETLDTCVRSTTAAQLLPVLFKRELDLHQLTFALGETIAHLNFLWHAGTLKRDEGTDGILRFSAT